MDKTYFDKFAMQMVAQTNKGELLFSTVCPPFDIEDSQCIALKAWMNCPQNIELHGKLSILVPKKADCSMYNFQFNLVDNEFKELTLATFENIKKCYCIRIMVIFAFKQSLLLPSAQAPTIEVNNMFLTLGY